MGGEKKGREARKARREALRPYRHRIYREAALLFTQGEENRAKALRLALAGGLVDENTLGRFMATIEEKGVEGVYEEVERFLSSHPPLKERRAPPEGWGLMRGILDELRLEKLIRGPGESPVELLLFLATELAHFAPLHRAFLAQAIYELYGKEPEKLLSLSGLGAPSAQVRTRGPAHAAHFGERPQRPVKALWESQHLPRTLVKKRSGMLT
jgi:hypothetical protein